MTTTVVVRKNGWACLAADTQATYGNSRESSEYIVEHDKVLSIGDALLCPTGPASAQLVLRSYFQDPERPRAFGDSLEIFETMRAMQSCLVDKYFLNPKEADDDAYDSLQMELMVASPGGIFGVYPLRSVQEYTRFYAFGSGAEVALGALHVLYEQHDDPATIAERAVEAAAAFDTSTGLPCIAHRVELSQRSS